MAIIPFRIDLDQGLVCTNAAGLVLTKDLIISTIGAIYADPDYHRDLNVIHDFSRIVMMDISYDDLHAIVDADAREDGHRGKSAIVTGDHKANTLFAKVYEAIAPVRLQLLPRVFERMEDAESWIFTEPPES